MTYTVNVPSSPDPLVLAPLVFNLLPPLLLGIGATLATFDVLVGVKEEEEAAAAAATAAPAPSEESGVEAFDWEKEEGCSGAA